jgi:hypothetical protein
LPRSNVMWADVLKAVVVTLVTVVAEKIVESVKES